MEMINQVNQVNVEGRERGRVRVRRRSRRKSKKPLMILVILLIASCGASAIGFVASSIRYSSDLSIAQVGLEHLQKAEALFAVSPQNLLDAHTVEQAQ